MLQKTVNAPNLSELKERYFREGISYLPHLLELIDKNRLSSTYGCFDRSYWHYRVIDFPSGMFQEAVLPLALAYQLDHPQNPYYRVERIRELVIAGIDFAQKSAHPDGSCDDYFPYERATGAAAFALYACTEAALILGIKENRFADFFIQRGKYLAGKGYDESGVLSNHKALIILALFNVYLVTGDISFKEAAEQKLQHLLSLQASEGWFPEYQGCDPGYLTFTIDFLAKYYQKSKDNSVIEPLRLAVEFVSHFMAPDGSFGGEYGSRNTFHFVPHGFEVLGPLMPKAVMLTNRFLDGIKNQKRGYLEDDRIFIHYTYNFLQSFQDICRERGGYPELQEISFSKYFEKSGFYVCQQKDDYAVVSTLKGGTGKIFKNKSLKSSDTGYVGVLSDGSKFISQFYGGSRASLSEKSLTIEGVCYRHKDTVFSPFLFWIFRAGLLMIGRFLPANVVRQFLQKKAILKKASKIPLRYRKEYPLDFSGVEHIFVLEDPALKIKELWISTDATFIYVATSQPFQSGNLKSWIDLSSLLETLYRDGKATFKQEFS